MNKLSIFVIAAPFVIVGCILVSAFVFRSVIPYQDLTQRLDTVTVAPVPTLSGGPGVKPTIEFRDIRTGPVPTFHPQDPVVDLRLQYEAMSSNVYSINELDPLQKQAVSL